MARVLLSVCAVLLLLAGLAWSALMLWVMLRLEGNDFGRFYFDSLALVNGQAMYLPNPDAVVQLASGQVKHPNLNPPHAMLLWVPFVMLPVRVASLVWLGMGAALFLGSVVAANRWSSASLTGPVWGLVGAWCLANAGTQGVLLTGQVGLHLALGALALWWLASGRRWGWAGVVLGVLLSLKPFFLLLAPLLLWRGGKRLLMGALGSTSAVWVLGLLVCGPSSYLAWLHGFGALEWASRPLNASIRGLLARSLAPSELFQPLAELPSLSSALALMAFVILCAGALVWAARSPTRSLAWQLAGLCLVAIMASPLGWVYYVPIVVPLGLLCWRECRLLWVLLGALILLVPTHAATLGQPSGALSALLGSVHFWGLLCWLVAWVLGPRVQPTSQVHV